MGEVNRAKDDSVSLHSGRNKDQTNEMWKVLSNSILLFPPLVLLTPPRSPSPLPHFSNSSPCGLPLPSPFSPSRLPSFHTPFIFSSLDSLPPSLCPPSPSPIFSPPSTISFYSPPLSCSSSSSSFTSYSPFLPSSSFSLFISFPTFHLLPMSSLSCPSFYFSSLLLQHLLLSLQLLLLLHRHHLHLRLSLSAQVR